MRRPWINAANPLQQDWTKLLGEMDLGGLGLPQQSSRLKETPEFGPNPGALRMFSYAPQDLAAGSPLVVALHGCGQSAADYDSGVGWSELADRLGFAVLAPEQTRANNANGCFNWFRPSDTARDHGEAASIRQMISRAVADHDLNPSRVYISGLSAGGAMTSVMLATYPEVFAGGAIIAGLPFGAATNVREALDSMRRAPVRTRQAWGDLVRAASQHRGPWPRLSVWHGDADTTVSIGNADAIIAQWSDVMGLPESPSERDLVNGYPHRVWRDGRGQPALEAYTLTGMGHGTPILSGAAEDACGGARAFILEAGISSSYQISKFWGLTAGARIKAPDPSVSAATAKSEPEHAFRAGAAHHSAALDPQKLIAGALKAAGLLKRP